MTSTTDLDRTAPAPAPSDVEDAVRRAAPDPGIRLPQVALPTAALWVVSLAVWVVATLTALRVVDGELGAAWLLVTVPVHAAVTFTMFTVLHESVHHAAGQRSWVNAVLGRLSMPFVAVWGSFPMFRYLHIEHHRNTNDDVTTDPDAWTEMGPTWQLPLRWLAMDLWYFRFYAPRLPRRPRGERIGFLLNLGVVLVAIAALVATGHGWALLAVYVVPQRLGVGLLAWWFDWLPHHDLDTTAKTDRFRATRVRVGWERVMTPLMFSQNYHLVHHIHPTIPFYRYVQAWRRTEADYLAREVPIATSWGRSLSADEYRAWRQLAADAATPATAGRAAFSPLVVADVSELTADAVAITFGVPAELRESFDFRAGQHVTVQALVDGEPVRRCYSVCTPAGSGVLRVAVRLVEAGRFARVARALQPGDVLDVQPPAGRFVLTDPPGHGRHLAAVAAGSGITPVLSILATALAREPDSRATLLYANRDTGSTMLAAELTELVRQAEGRLRVVHLHSRAAADAQRPQEPVLAGRLTRERLLELLDAEGLDRADEWYLCGPEALLDTVTEVLAEAGVAPADVHRELFTAAAPAAPTADAPALVPAAVEVVLDGRSTVVQTGGDESLLEAALRTGLDAPYSCTGGACGTCRALLRCGTVHMQSAAALTDEERGDGWVLTCQSRPTSDRLQLDYDA